MQRYTKIVVCAQQNYKFYCAWDRDFQKLQPILSHPVGFDGNPMGTKSCTIKLPIPDIGESLKNELVIEEPINATDFESFNSVVDSYVTNGDGMAVEEQIFEEIVYDIGQGWA